MAQDPGTTIMFMTTLCVMTHIHFIHFCIFSKMSTEVAVQVCQLGHILFTSQLPGNSHCFALFKRFVNIFNSPSFAS